MDIESKIIHTGLHIDTAYASVSPPIYSTSVFAVDNVDNLEQLPEFHYSRTANPTRKALEENLAALEGGAKASVTSSGMSATTLIFFLLETADQIITSSSIYGGNYRLFSQIAPQFGVDVVFLDEIDDLPTLKSSITAKTKLIWLETPSNPLFKMTDIKAVCQEVKSIKPDILIVADNTFMTPIYQRPLELGCDVAMHSSSKFINGHSDVIAGALVAKDAEVGEKINYYNNSLGLASPPFDCWLTLRGVRTLSVRMARHQENALKVAAFLQEHPLIKKVFYPGLEEHTGHLLAKEQMHGFGGVLSFSLDLDRCDLQSFLKSLNYFSLTLSLGGVESLIAQPYNMSHACMPRETRLKIGIDESIIRLSVGIESATDLIADLSQALDQGMESCCCY